MVELEQVLDVLAESLDGATQIHQMNEEAPLLGAIPELDSMAIVGIITSIEERFGIVFDDDELDADVFETVGTLRNQIVAKMEN
jgi:acyl carrier protein|tara:strand:+ start:208 stop:459 length:252 start_codon:yes stop_codon:yes gene_type:complete